MPLSYDIFLGLYLISASAIAFFGLYQAVLSAKPIVRVNHQRFASKFVAQPLTIQVPVYNEPTMVKGLLDSLLNLDYPAHLLHIQILDDSIDQTSAIIAGLLPKFLAKGIEVEHVQRKNRKGFKAGALKAGLEKGTYDLIAIFDADFRPDPKFFHTIIPYFSDSKIGFVQATWAHSNRNENALTRGLALGLDHHFYNEQNARFASGAFNNFNGTAGVWRKPCIENAGNWSSESLAEDLDLSFRAQLNGWKAIFLPGLTVDSELPPDINAAITQQKRWANGGAACARLLLKVILKAKLPLSTKFHGTAQLLSPLIWPAMFLSLLLAPFLSFYGHLPPSYEVLQKGFGLFFILGTVGFLIAYWNASKKGQGGIGLLAYSKDFFNLTTLMISLTPICAIEVFKGFKKRQYTFERTPKRLGRFSSKKMQTALTTRWKQFYFVLLLIQLSGLAANLYFQHFVFSGIMMLTCISIIRIMFISLSENKAHQPEEMSELRMNKKMEKPLQYV
jgi:cellulose synthase/poly-beta-1,6-N-acetylglucosamine synthase-like glycosyltransferase